jgi:TonB-dependent receptor
VKKFFTLLLLVLSSSIIFAQKARVSGKVTNSRNEGLAGVTIKISGGTTGITKTDVEGRFTINVEPGKKYSISLSYVGYKEKTIDDISVDKANGEEFLSVNLDESGKALDAVTVKSTARGSAKGETVNALIAFQKNTNTVASVISAEAIRRSPDKNTGEVLKRTPGASIQDGKFLIVRGLAERYNLAMLNGVQLGSTEPDRKAFSFDLIPSNMIDNIIINKAFVPELPGEWAGGLIQVNTRDIPSKNFFNIQIGTGVNLQTIGNDFQAYQGGKTDWLGIDDGTRSLPAGYSTKSQFDALSAQQKTAIGKDFQNIWNPSVNNSAMARMNGQFQISGGFTAKGKKDRKLGGIFGLTYNKTSRYLKGTNSGFNFIGNGKFTPDFAFNDDRYSTDILWGALGNISYQFDNNNKISFKTLFNINANNFTTLRTGVEGNGNTTLDSTRAYELGFKQNTFWNNQISGEHNLKPNVLKLKWYGSFTVLDGYTPDQRRLYYLKNNSNINNPYVALLSNTLSQKSGNRFYQNLNDYIYTAGADLAYTFDAFGAKQTVKGGYQFQVKDRLFDAKPFSIYLPRDNAALRLLNPGAIFAQGNFGDGSTTSTSLAFDAIKGNLYRYLANTILNAAYIQFDNQLGDKLRLVWGVRMEDYDQLVGAVKASDPRYNYTKVTDFLPGINATYKLDQKTNLRLSASQTVVRPEFRELASFQYYDFELNAAVQGLPTLERTKVSNIDVRYELYPRAGEVFTAGIFYKHFDKPIEMIFNFGAGGASTFNFANPSSADAYGLELEFRKKLDFSEALKHFTFLVNGTYISSKVKDARLELNRPLQGQSPYLINASILYDLEEKGFSATLLYNQIGRRVTFVGSQDQPDIYESSRPVFDLQLTKKLMKNKAELRLNVQDILNQPLYFYQNPDGNTNLDKSKDPFRLSRQFGTTISFTFGYSL